MNHDACADAHEEALRLAGPPDPATPSVHRAEYLRLHRRRHEDAGSRVRQDEAAVLGAALAARGRTAPPSAAVAGFPWTDRFTDACHPLDDASVSFVRVPPGEVQATAGHAVDLRRELDGADSVLLAYPASWGVQNGMREESFRGEVLDYLRNAPRYLAATATYGDRFAAAAGLGGRVLVPVVPTIDQHERKLTEFALARPDFVHPFALRSGRLLAEVLLGLAAEDRLPRRLVLFGFSYGAALAVQHLRVLAAHPTLQADGGALLARLRESLSLVLVACNVDYPAELPFRLLALRSPLDTVVLGGEDPLLHTSCRQDFAELALPAVTRAHLLRGAYEAVRGEMHPVVLGPGRIQLNCPLPGAVGLDESGRPLRHFEDLRDGHDIRAYQPVFERPEIRRLLAPPARSGFTHASRLPDLVHLPGLAALFGRAETVTEPESC